MHRLAHGAALALAASASHMNKSRKIRFIVTSIQIETSRSGRVPAPSSRSLDRCRHSATWSDAWLTRPSMCTRSLPRGRRQGFVDDFPQKFVEGRRVLDLRDMAYALDHGELGAGDELREAFALGKRGDAVE